MEVIGLEILKAIGRFFLHPLTYIFILAAFWLGIRRVKRERKDFHTRVYDVVQQVISPLGVALITGMTVSVLLLLLGVEVPVGMLALLSAVWIILLPFGNARWLSMTVAGSVSLFIIPFLPDGGTNYAWLNSWLADIGNVNVLGVISLLVILFLAESLLILIDGWKQTSPSILKSKRGKMVGEHVAVRLWFLPLFLLFPIGTLSGEGTGWWPLLQLTGGQTFGLALFPFMIGFQAKIHSTLPIEGVKKIGKHLLALNILVIALAVSAFFYPIIALTVPAVILLGRECIYFFYRAADKRRLSLFARREDGLKILGVLPHSTADKMGLVVGEIIWKTNGLQVSSQGDFYHALQQNPAFCKLEVIDYAGEKRFAQSSIFQGDHYQIGCLFVPDDEFGNLSSRALRSSVVIQLDRSELDEEIDDHTVVEEAEETVAETDHNNQIEKKLSEVEDETASSVEEKPPQNKKDEVAVLSEREKTFDETADLKKKERFFQQEKNSHQEGKAYGQAAGLSAFYEDFSKSKPEKNTWTPEAEENRTELEGSEENPSQLSKNKEENKD